MEVQREDDAGTAVHPPDQEADAIFRRAREAHLVEHELPVERVALGPEGGAKRATIWLVTGGHESLQVVARNQFMVDGGPRKMDVVAAQALQLGIVGHRVSWE